MNSTMKANISDRSRLLRIEIYLKVYVLILALGGCIFLKFLGVFGFINLPEKALGSVLFLFAMLNAVYLRVLQRKVWPSLLYASVGLTDILFFTILIHYMGGADAPVLALLYMLPIPFFSILISPWSGYLVATGSCVAYSLLCGLEYSGILKSYGSAPISLEKLGIILFFLFFCFISVAFYVGYFSEVLRRHQDALAKANDEIEQHNVTLEEEIANRTRELKSAQVKLEAYSKELEEAYNEKSLQLEEVQKRLESSLSELTLKYTYENIVGGSRSMQEVFGLMDKVTDFNVPVLVQGASGTGKELVAKAIHYNGPRREKPFVIQNCSAITDTLLESELFGHVKGAFTGAIQDRKGLIEEADKGTLFLDEVSDMSSSMQAKLLRAIQEGEVRPVGGKKVINVDVRIISATNTDLNRVVEQGRFREDLYYRLNGVAINLPSLMERREDIILLAENFLERFAEEAGISQKSLAHDAKRTLLSYSWPGNVRELENTIKNACVIAEGDEIQVEDFRYKLELFSEILGQEGGRRVGDRRSGGGLTFSEDSGLHFASSSENGRLGPGGSVTGIDSASPVIKSLKETEKEAIEDALKVCKGKRKDAALLLNIPIRTLYEKIKRYGITS